MALSVTMALCKKCPNTEFFSGPYFPVFGQKDIPYLSVFSSNAGKYEPEKNSVFGHFSRSVDVPVKQPISLVC